MGDDLIITSQNGKQYKGLRAYRIALGHAVRQALLNFAKEIEEYCSNRVAQFYGEYSPEYYDRTNQLYDKMKLQQLIKTEIKGSFQQDKAKFEIDVFDWSVLDSYDNGLGYFGTYSNFKKQDSREELEEYFSNGIYGHSEFNLRDEVQQYINKNLNDVINKALRSI